MVEMVNTKFERYFVQPLLAAAWLPDKYSAGAAPLTPPVEADNKMKSLSNKRQGAGREALREGRLKKKHCYRAVGSNNYVGC